MKPQAFRLSRYRGIIKAGVMHDLLLKYGNDPEWPVGALWEEADDIADLFIQARVDFENYQRCEKEASF